MNEVLKVLKERRSCRSYRPEQITDAELDAVLEAGTYAPPPGASSPRSSWQCRIPLWWSSCGR